MSDEKHSKRKKRKREPSDSDDEISDESKSWDEKRNKRIKNTKDSHESQQYAEPVHELESKKSKKVKKATLQGREKIKELGEFLFKDVKQRELLQNYIQCSAKKAGGKSLDDRQERKTLKLDAWLDVAMNVCQSRAWGATIKEKLKHYPKFEEVGRRSNLPKGDIEHLNTCQVCNRQKSLWSIKVKLSGKPYNRKTYRKVDKSKTETTLDVYMGRFCYLRTKLFHSLYHFGHDIYLECKDKLERYGDNKKNKIGKVAKDMFEEMYDKLMKLMRETYRDYTVDGKRGNNIFNREKKVKVGSIPRA